MLLVRPYDPRMMVKFLSPTAHILTLLQRSTVLSYGSSSGLRAPKTTEDLFCLLLYSSLITHSRSVFSKVIMKTCSNTRSKISIVTEITDTVYK